MSRNLLALVLMALACLATVYGQAPFWPLPADYTVGMNQVALGGNFKFTANGVTGEAATILRNNFKRYTDLFHVPKSSTGMYFFIIFFLFFFTA